MKQQHNRHMMSRRQKTRVYTNNTRVLAQAVLWLIKGEWWAFVRLGTLSTYRTGGTSAHGDSSKIQIDWNTSVVFFSFEAWRLGKS
jgi:hypothetical protein